VVNSITALPDHEGHHEAHQETSKSVKEDWEQALSYYSIIIQCIEMIEQLNVFELFCKIKNFGAIIERHSFREIRIWRERVRDISEDQRGLPLQ
jgi:hypothetical protein